ncbi:MAG: hypothetical protein ABR540_12615 [Acidimicrobiales bacterium]|nr:hypothetical protein [Actinomycetota bacterium]
MALLRLDTWAAVHPEWRPRLAELCNRTGCRLGSVWRSRELQAHWRRCWENGCRGLADCHGVPGNCPGANLPDSSFHETAEEVTGVPQLRLDRAGLALASESGPGKAVVPCALAVDLDWTGDAIWRAHELAPELGLHFPIWKAREDEEWHVQPIEVPHTESPHKWWSPFDSLTKWIGAAPDPWDALFVPVITIG